MGGVESDMFSYFKSLFIQGLFKLRTHTEALINMVEIMANGSNFPCFRKNEVAINELKERFKCCYSDDECLRTVESMIYYSMGNWRTVQYDIYQKLTNDIYQ